MNLSPERWLLILTLIFVPVLGRAQEMVPVSNGEPVWQPASEWDSGTGLFRSRDVPRDYNPLLLTLGRSVYADLQRARQAAIHKEAVNLSVALHEARDTLHRLQLPAGVIALDAQRRVIRNDLHDQGKISDDSLWVPVEAEINRVLVYAPDNARGRVAAALRAGKNAAGHGDSQTAEDQLDVVSGSVQYSLGMFPLNKVSTDLGAALAAAGRRPTPDWDGALQAIQDTLATFHWYPQAQTDSLLSAYNNVTHAYVLVQGMYAHPEQWRQVRSYLIKAQRRLASTPGDWGLATRTGDAINKLERNRDDASSGIMSLLNAIQAQMLQQRQHAKEHYRETLVPAVTT